MDLGIVMGFEISGNAAFGVSNVAFSNTFLVSSFLSSVLLESPDDLPNEKVESVLGAETLFDPKANNAGDFAVAES